MLNHSNGALELGGTCFSNCDGLSRVDFQGQVITLFSQLSAAEAKRIARESELFAWLSDSLSQEKDLYKPLLYKNGAYGVSETELASVCGELVIIKVSSWWILVTFFWCSP